MWPFGCSGCQRTNRMYMHPILSFIIICSQYATRRGARGRLVVPNFAAFPIDLDMESKELPFFAW